MQLKVINIVENPRIITPRYLAKQRELLERENEILGLEDIPVMTMNRVEKIKDKTMSGLKKGILALDLIQEARITNKNIYFNDPETPIIEN